MSFEQHHPLRDALVILLGLYLLWAFVDAPWDDALPQSPQSPAGAPLPLAPDHNAQHHNTTVTFSWEPVSVTYGVVVRNSTGVEVVYVSGLTGVGYRTGELPPDDYRYALTLASLDGNPYVLEQGWHNLSVPARIELEWEPLSITYDFRLERQGQAEPVAEYAGLRGTEVTESGLVAGATYTWQVRGWDSGAPDGLHASNWSYPQTLAVGTTNHLAYELFEQWELPFVLVGMILLVALVAGVFLAREEPQ